MKTQIIGGGLLGLSSALMLHLDGVEVELLELEHDVGMATSFANGGMLTPSMSDPWNAPGVFGHLFSSLFDPQAAMKLRLHAVPSLLSWGVRFLAHASEARHRQATLDNYQLAAYSVEKTREVSERFNLSYAQARQGVVKVFRDLRALKHSQQLNALVAPLGLQFEVLNSQQTIALEPQLASIQEHIKGAIYYPGDVSGDAYLFCRELRRILQQCHVPIKTGVRVQRLMVKKGRYAGLLTDQGVIHGERVVIAAGNGSAALLKPLGQSVPIKPVKGYTLTYTLNDSRLLPKHPVVDDAMHAAVTPLGNRLRVAGTAEFTGFDTTLTPERIDNLFNLVRQLYPQIADVMTRAETSQWAGLRPMSCDGRPLIGASKIPGVYLNTGHGHLGWTKAIGSACLLVDLMANRRPAINPAPFAATR